MTVYLFSPSYEIGEIINDHLLSCKYSSFLFSTTDELSKTIENQKKLPDLLVLDYLTFNHDFFNIHLHLNQLKMELPVIFFNDPCIIASTRTKHWLYQLNTLTYKEPEKTFSDEEISDYEKLFKCIQEIVELEELTPYINLMQKTRPLPSKFKKQTITIDYIKMNNTEFKDNIILPNNLSYLLNILQRNKTTPLTLEEITEFYKKEGKQMTENSLKVLISKLRKEIRNQKDCNFIISNQKGAYSFIDLGKS